MRERKRDEKKTHENSALGAHNDSKWGSLKSIIFPICSTLQQYLESCSQNISYHFTKFS